MINFTIGPVQSFESTRKIGSENVPYFRTSEFSGIMLENEDLIKQFVHAPEGSRVVFITGSGTAAMEAAVMNVLTEEDRALIINGGSFGSRFCNICDIHDIPYDDIVLNAGKQLRKEDLYGSGRYSALIVNMHETSTGVLYDMDMISDYCKKNNLLLISDCISSFLCDDFDMSKLGVDVMIASSQKALSCPPGVGILVLSPRALDNVNNIRSKSLYFDVYDMLSNQDRGQTPFTPAVQVLIQINERLRGIKNSGGVKSEIERVSSLAAYFRDKITCLDRTIKDFPLKIASESLSNALTPLYITNGMSAYKDIFLKLQEDYGIWVCPSGGILKDKLFRVGHMGNLKPEDYDKLISALKEILK